MVDVTVGVKEGVLVMVGVKVQVNPTRLVTGFDTNTFWVNRQVRRSISLARLIMVSAQDPPDKLVTVTEKEREPEASGAR